MNRKRPTNTGPSEETARSARTGDRPALRPGEAQIREALWDVEQVALYLRLSVDAIYRMTARRGSTRIPYIRLARKLRFRKEDIDRWLELQTISNLDVLARMQGVLTKVNHGHDP